MNPYIKTSERTCLPKTQEAVNQPLGIDYSKLANSMSQLEEKDKRKIEKKSSVDGKLLKDFRKISNNESISKELEENDSINNINKSSIIPVPGLMISFENSGSDTRPPDSDWVASHGPQWGPMTT